MLNDFEKKKIYLKYDEFYEKNVPKPNVSVKIKCDNLYGAGVILHRRSTLYLPINQCAVGLFEH